MSEGSTANWEENYARQLSDNITHTGPPRIPPQEILGL